MRNVVFVLLGLISALLGACAQHEGNTPSPAAPVVVAAEARSYVDAVQAHNLDALVNSFTEDAVVVDVGRRIAGRNRIRQWAQDEVIGGRIEVLGRTPMADGEDLLVRFAPGGRGRGFEAHYQFTYHDGRIAHADLTYA